MGEPNGFTGLFGFYGCLMQPVKMNDPVKAVVFFVFIPLASICFTLPLFASPGPGPIIVEDDTFSIKMNANMWIFQPRADAIAFDRVIESDETNFIPLYRDGQPFILSQFSRSDRSSKPYIWVKVSLMNPTSRQKVVYLDANVEPIRTNMRYKKVFHVVNKNGRQVVREIKHGPLGENYLPVFHFTLPSHSESELYYLIEEPIHLSAPVYLSTNSSFCTGMLFSIWALGVFYGICFVLLITNLFIYMSLRDPVYLYLMSFIFLSALLHSITDGYWAIYQPEASTDITTGMILIVPLLVISSLSLQRKLCATKLKCPAHDKIFRYFILANAFLVLLYVCLKPYLDFESPTYNNDITNLYRLFVFSFSMLVKPFELSGAFYAARAGNQEAKFYLIARSVYVSTLIMTAVLLVFAPKYFSFSVEVYKLGCVCECLLYSFALAAFIKRRKLQLLEQIVDRKLAMDDIENLKRSNDNRLLKQSENVHQLFIKLAKAHLNIHDLKSLKDRLEDQSKIGQESDRRRTGSA